jgi:hypothetical protein
MHFSRWSNLAKFLPLVRARIVSGHLTESDQFFEKCKSFNFSPQVRWKCEPAVLGENLLNMTSVFDVTHFITLLCLMPDNFNLVRRAFCLHSWRSMKMVLGLDGHMTHFDIIYVKSNLCLFILILLLMDGNQGRSDRGGVGGCDTPPTRTIWKFQVNPWKTGIKKSGKKSWKPITKTGK